MGAGASTLPAAVDKSTAQGFAGDKFDEAAFDKYATDGSVPKEVIVAAATAPGEGVDFSKLQTAPDGFFSIPDTARRAVNLDQLNLIAEHCCRELGYDLIVNECAGCHGGRFRDVEIKKKEEGEGKVWYVGRFKEGKFGKEPLRDPHQVNLYDCATYVIHPATKPKEASMVEIMCVAEQPPDFVRRHQSSRRPWPDAPALMVSGSFLYVAVRLAFLGRAHHRVPQMPLRALRGAGSHARKRHVRR